MEDQIYASAIARIDLRKILKRTNNYAVRLYVYYGNHLYPPYLLPVKVTKNEWEIIRSNKRIKDEKLNKYRSIILAAEEKARKIIVQLGGAFNFDNFDLLYSGTRTKNTSHLSLNVFDGFKTKISECEQNEKYGTASIYNDAMVCLRKFHEELRFPQVTTTFLRNFESYMLSRGYSITTVALYMRCLRHIYKRAIKAKLIARDKLPFGSGNTDETDKYKVPASKNHKRPLAEQDLVKLLKYEPTWDSEAKAFSLWCFCFFSNGMNPVDAFNLKYEQFTGDFLNYVRQKTVDTTKEKKEIEIYNSPAIQAIVDRWGNKDKTPGNYVFDIFNLNQTAKERYRARKLYIRVMNDRMQDIAKKLGITARITTMVARHSWATTLMRQGFSIAYIQKGFGHTSITTTENYLGDFTPDQKKEAGLLLHKLAQ